MQSETLPEGGSATGETTEQNANSTLSIDEVTEVLRSRRRRRAVEFLNQNAEPGFGDLAEAVAESEFGPGYSNEERKRVYVALYQSHTPKLDDYGVVEFEGTGNPVRRGPAFDAAVRYLRALQRVEDEERGSEETRGESRFHTLRDLL